MQPKPELVWSRGTRQETRIKHDLLCYRKIPIISPGLYLSKGQFFAGFISGGAYCWREFCVSKWVRLDNKNSLKHQEYGQKTAHPNSPWAYIQEGLLSEGYLLLRFGGLIFGRAYYRNFVVYALNIPEF